MLAEKRCDRMRAAHMGRSRHAGVFVVVVVVVAADVVHYCLFANVCNRNAPLTI